MSDAAPAVDVTSAARGMALACRDVAFSYEEARAPIPALRGVGFELAAGRSLALLGASGSGKSTLLQVVKGLDAPEAGAVVLDGAAAGRPATRASQREVGLVFQTPELQLFAVSAREDVAFGPRRLGWSEAEVAAAVDEAMELVGLPPADVRRAAPLRPLRRRAAPPGARRRARHAAAPAAARRAVREPRPGDAPRAREHPAAPARRTA